MKWRAVKDDKGEISQLVVQSDSHTIIRATDRLFIVFRKGYPRAVIIGRYSTAALARQCCEQDYEGKPFPDDTTTTYPPGKPTLDAPEPEDPP